MSKDFYKLLVVGRSGNGVTSTVKSLLASGNCADRDYITRQALGGASQFGFTSGVQLDLFGTSQLDLAGTSQNVPAYTRHVIDRRGQVNLTSAKNFHVHQNDSVTIVDGCGLADADDVNYIPEEATNKQITDMFLKITGISAIIFVLRYGVRFTKQDIKSVKKINKIFGDNIFKERGIIVMTYGDNFDLDNENKVSYAMQGIHFSSFLNECRNRIVMFDNKRPDPTRQQRQKDELMLMVRRILYNTNTLYTLRDFNWNILKSSRPAQFVNPLFKRRYTAAYIRAVWCPDYFMYFSSVSFVLLALVMSAAYVIAVLKRMI